MVYVLVKSLSHAGTFTCVKQVLGIEAVVSFSWSRGSASRKKYFYTLSRNARASITRIQM